jgi:hypothetical protein
MINGQKLREEVIKARELFLYPQKGDFSSSLSAAAIVYLAYGLGSRTAENIFNEWCKMRGGRKKPNRNLALSLAAELFRLAEKETNKTHQNHSQR